MSNSVDDLILDLLEWLGAEARPYAEVLEAWRTSCPRLPIWEEANERKYVERFHVPGSGPLVTPSALGVEYLRRARPDARRLIDLSG